MSNAWEITTDDVLNVAHEMGMKLTTEETEKIYNDLDHFLIEEAALNGKDLEEQTDYAYEEIKRQITENKKEV
jgi:hypothetical protein